MAERATYRDYLLSIKNMPLSSIYVITGAEDFLRETAIALIIDKAKEGGEEISHVKIYGDEAESDRLSMSLSSLSLFSETQVIHIKNASKMKVDCWNIIKEYILAPSDSNIVVIEDSQIDGRKDYAKALKKSFGWYEFKELYPNELFTWIKRYSKKNGITISDGAIHLLMNSTESGLRNYVHEFEKIKLYLGEKNIIDEEAMTQFSNSMKSFNVFDFVDALCSLKRDSVLEQMKKVFVFQESIPGILVILTRHLTNLLKIKLLAEQGHARGDVKTMGLPPFIYRKYVAQSSNFNVADLEVLLEGILLADTHLKTGYQNEKVILTVLVHKFISILDKSAA